MSQHEDMPSIANDIAREFQQPGNVAEIMHDKGGSKVHVSKVQGRRSGQEDEFRQFSGLRLIKKKTYEAWLADTFKTIGRDTKDERNGSTCTLAVIGRDRHITVAHVGDSPAILFMRNRNTGEVSWKELTTDHHPSVPAEAQRIRAAGGRLDVTGTRIEGDNRHTLSVSRSFGDQSHQPGISCKPDIGHYALDTLAPAEHTDFYLMVCSDGALDRDGFTDAQRKRMSEIQAYYRTNPRYAPSDAELDEIEALEKAIYRSPTRQQAIEQLAEVIGRYGAADSHNLAQLLTAKALHGGSRDNVTILVSKVEPEMTRDTMLMVADGHGGAGCAKAVGEGVDRHVNVLKMNAELVDDPSAFWRKRLDLGGDFPGSPRQRR